MIAAPGRTKLQVGARRDNFKARYHLSVASYRGARRQPTPRYRLDGVAMHIGLRLKGFLGGLFVALASVAASAQQREADRPAAAVSDPWKADARHPPTEDGRGALEALFASLAAQGERVAGFVERRHSALFRQPVELKGTLRFVPPALLERDVASPRRESVRIDGEQVTVRTWGEDGKTQTHRLALAAQPQLAALADALRAILAGDFAALERRFVVRLTQPPPRWSVELAPREEPTPVASIRLAGAAREVERLEIVEASGDRIEILLTPRR